MSYYRTDLAIDLLHQVYEWRKDEDPDHVMRLFNILQAPQRNYPSVIALQNEIVILQRTAIGKQAPSFDLPGRPGSLKSYSRVSAKYILIEFWASWCMPCRKENPQLVKAYEKYKSKGSEIISISIDKQTDNEKWTEAIRTDRLNWTNLHDAMITKGKENAATGIHNSSSIWGQKYSCQLPD
jgi:peroxiredoxin